MVSLPRRRPNGVRVGGVVREEEPDAHLHRLGLAGGLQVQLHDEVAVGLEPPRHALRRGPRLLPRRPTQHVAGGIGGVLHHAADVPGLGIGRVEPARRAGAIDADVRVMHAAAVAGPELDGTNVARAVCRNRQDEGAEEIRTVRPQGVGLRHRHHDVGSAELPPLCERRHAAEGRRGSPSGPPWATQSWKRLNLLVGERAFVQEQSPRAFSRLPRWHRLRRLVASAISVIRWRTSR